MSVTAPAFAGTTKVTLYRLGNASAPRMDNVRADKDAEIFQKDGKDWVRAKKSKGMSTSAVASSEKNEWKLPKGATYSDDLALVNDTGNHWQFEPAKDMPLETYKKLLLEVQTFEKVQ